MKIKIRNPVVRMLSLLLIVLSIGVCLAGVALAEGRIIHIASIADEEAAKEAGMNIDDYMQSQYSDSSSNEISSGEDSYSDDSYSDDMTLDDYLEKNRYNSYSFLLPFSTKYELWDCPLTYSPYNVVLQYDSGYLREVPNDIKDNLVWDETRTSGIAWASDDSGNVVYCIQPMYLPFTDGTVKWYYVMTVSSGQEAKNLFSAGYIPELNFNMIQAVHDAGLDFEAGQTVGHTVQLNHNCMEYNDAFMEKKEDGTNRALQVVSIVFPAGDGVEELVQG